MEEHRERKGSNVTPQLKLVGSPLLSRDNSYKSEPTVVGFQQELGNDANFDRVDSKLLRDVPIFQRHEESTTIELFYDLFFVANLATFSNIHEINNTRTLTSYIGFFCILWFTWCLTSLHDIRFVSDSVLSRLLKGAHLGVMVGLAVSGPKFDTSEKHNAQLKVMALVLMVSRLILAVQYLIVMFHVREYARAKLPLFLVSLASFLAAMIYLGISFAFSHSIIAHRALYVIAVAEMVATIGIASQWKVVSFKGTHLVERMSLLTLYILGEGVIHILATVAKISKSQDHWTAANIGALIGAISGIYLFYMLYFDTINREHFGSIRQQLWAFLHFPFHAALVLCLSGMAQFVIFQKIMEGFNAFNEIFTNNLISFLNEVQSGTNNIEDDILHYITAIQDSLNKTLTAYPPVNALEVNENLSELVEKFKEQLTEYIKALSENANASIDAASSAGSDIEAALLLSLQETFGFEAAEDKVEEAGNNSLLKTVASLDTATLIFQFFFIATGMTIIIMGILGLINVRVYTKGSWLRFATHVSVGITCCLLCLLSLGEGDRAVSLSMTAWPLPMVAFFVFIVLAVHHVSWEVKDGQSAKKYHFLPRWRPNRHTGV
ncbi:hypothetical protein V490_06639 [Pseudogymnoascus sp. VKM F-3557]|nr:hypothetical protein V490_06639 [Pseudogymnoascus sp. VKM F-3557]